MPNTPEQHAEQGGTCCPFCGSEQIEGLEVVMSCGGASQETFCLDCQGSWADTYTLTGYTVIEELEHAQQ